VIRVALDAMGGDNAPSVEVEGAVQALKELPPTFVIQLVGKTDLIEAELKRYPEIDRNRIEIHEAPEVIGMGEKPLTAIRKKRKSGIVVGLSMQKAGQSDAFISAGNTGAVLAAGTVLLGLHDGVERATVGTVFPTTDRPALVLDAGANLDCSARELVCFAHLGTVYMRDLMGQAKPVVGLLNVGEEEEKGNAIVKEAHQLLKQDRRLNYIGNIEGRDILAGHAKHGSVDVIVADGFVGNIVLKFYESVARMIVRMVKRDAPEVLERSDMRKIFKTLDYAEYGGAPLLGVQGVCIICHGSSPSSAVKNAVRVAVQAVEAGLSQHIGAEFAQREAATSA
jgi:glycerol-3-phosphate acyltransferase PlsX